MPGEEACEEGKIEDPLTILHINKKTRVDRRKEKLREDGNE